tara:strand:- start:60 stop:326 length:267 start_codon:yes stop_codon:yes gene_type:complete
MRKTNLIATAVLAFGLGGFTGVMTTNNDYIAMKATFIEHVQGNIDDMEWFVKGGALDSAHCDTFWLHNWSIIEKQLLETPEEYTSWYE